ncbi:MAG: ribbon-helix-helix protein, CopG family [Nitrospinota bacterium]
MSRSITIHLDDDAYKKFHEMAVEVNRSVSNLIETLALNKLEEELFTDTPLRHRKYCQISHCLQD